MRLIAYFLVIAVLVGVVGGIGYYSINGINSAFKLHHEMYMPFEHTISHIRPDVDGVIRATEEYDSDWMTKEEASEEIEEKKEHIEEHLIELKAAAAAAAAADMPTVSEIEELENSINSLYGLSGELFELHGKTKEERTPTMGEFDEQAEAIYDELEAMHIKVDTAIHNSAMEIAKMVYFAIIVIIVAVFITILLAITLGLYISKKITTPIEKLSKTVDEVSKGNFDVEVKKTTGIKEINTLAESLDRVMTTMKLAVMEKKEKKK